MNRIAVYPGSFDPITKGHEDLIHRSLGFVDRIVHRRDLRTEVARIIDYCEIR